MMYSEIEKLPAEAYLCPANFRTEYDSMPANEKRQAEQYETGLRIGREYDTVYINDRGVWGALRPGVTLTSYESIGYHACTAHLLLGFLHSGCTLKIYRNDGTVTLIRNQRIVEKKNSTLFQDA